MVDGPFSPLSLYKMGEGRSGRWLNSSSIDPLVGNWSAVDSDNNISWIINSFFVFILSLLSLSSSKEGETNCEVSQTCTRRVIAK